MNFFQLFTTNCKQATFLHTKLQDGKLSVWEQLALKIHLAYCSLCRTFFTQVDAIEKHTRNLANSELTLTQLSQEEKESLTQKIQQELHK